ncbi:hypothetical protein GO755_33465 [Spirosoma sp. HMF4905]|uniref:SH3 domain-containing protein n=1 Tax=Spirosoma arboris TaxID=2682092 RepID=A0A7K1SMF5_9BACT|nr:hypothetical protein [Spirosoma arboris]MVM34985.1 hypothetical protein [Spirosoma arboris]
MKIGASLKTKAGPDKNVDEFFFLYTKPGGTKIGSVKESTVIGIYERTESYLLTDYAYVKLATPLTYNSVRYQYAYIRQEVVYEYLANSATYYVIPGPNSVNVRSTATSASSKNILLVLKPNALIGTTDGTTSNGFTLFSLASGGMGWVSRNYITSKVPAGALPTPDGTGPEPEPSVGTTLENTVGTGLLGTLKWVGIGLVAVIVGLVIAKLYQRHAPKN